MDRDILTQIDMQLDSARLSSKAAWVILKQNGMTDEAASIANSILELQTLSEQIKDELLHSGLNTRA